MRKRGGAVDRSRRRGRPSRAVFDNRAEALRVLVLFLLVSSLLFRADAAFAHATLIASEPADGALLITPPKQVRLNFSEVIAPLALRLLDATGKITLLKTYRQGQQALIVDPAGDEGVRNR